MQPYKQSTSDTGFMKESSREGFREELIAENTYVVEYYGSPGYAKIDHDLLLSYAERRALEICPSGYDGEFKIIRQIEAHFPEFQCFIQYCANAELIANGTISCK